jgi:hypothetical protein
MVRKLALAASLLLAGLLVGGEAARAAELVMFDDPGCSWCRRWNAEIGPSYPRSAEGQLAPLRRIQIRDQANAGIALARPITVTPTFVLVHDEQEVGRIIGYAGSDFFYPRLGELLKQLPPPAPAHAPALRSTMCSEAACGRR